MSRRRESKVAPTAQGEHRSVLRHAAGSVRVIARGGGASRTPVAGVLRPSVRMEYHEDPTARVREQRFQGLVSDLVPKVRRLNPMMPDDQVLEMAESMAELRLLDEELG